MFVDVLHRAITTGPAVGLDFVYGEAREDGQFEPLDGQQRLTTLFLLHWYLASRAGCLDPTAPWTRFGYATRPSARRFCDQLTSHALPARGGVTPSLWITDQSWYLHLWRFDPSVSAMLVMLDSIAERFADVDPNAAWERLTDAEEPAVWFQLLPVSDMGAADALYIKMNSRGKPLTPFEAFKAHFGQVIAHTGRADEFGELVDGSWTNVLWPYRGDNNIVDDEFMRYFDFILEICEWREGRVRGEGRVRLERRAEQLLAEWNPRAAEHLDLIFNAFNCWLATESINSFMSDVFSTEPSPDRVRLFGSPTTDLFLTCCERYGSMRGSTRVFSLTDTLLLYATVLHLVHGTDDFHTRLRVIRNVNEASLFELRVQNMPKFVREVETFMRTGDLQSLATYNQNQVADEARKSAFLSQEPSSAECLRRLEDHNILRGTLAALPLDDQLAQRASAFEEVFRSENWPVLTGALLARGQYQRDHPKSDYHQFGSPTTESVWRTLLVDRGDRDSLAKTGAVVVDLLDLVVSQSSTESNALAAVLRDFVTEREHAALRDWRYYLVKYPWMREGRSGIYYGADRALAYELTMLDKTVQRSYYRDPYLYAIWRQAGSPDEVENPWFYGYSTTPRWMQLKASGTGIRSVHAGLAVRPGAAGTEELRAFMAHRDDAVLVEDSWLVRVPQQETDDGAVDTADRVVIGAALLEELLALGL